MVAFRKQARAALLAAALLAVVLIGAYVEGKLLPQPVALNITVQSAEALAALNGKTLGPAPTPKIQEYLDKNHYFENLNFQKLDASEIPSRLSLTLSNPHHYYLSLSRK